MQRRGFFIKSLAGLLAGAGAAKAIAQAPEPEKPAIVKGRLFMVHSLPSERKTELKPNDNTYMKVQRLPDAQALEVDSKVWLDNPYNPAVNGLYEVQDGSLTEKLKGIKRAHYWHQIYQEPIPEIIASDEVISISGENLKAGNVDDFGNAVLTVNFGNPAVQADIATKAYVDSLVGMKPTLAGTYRFKERDPMRHTAIDADDATRIKGLLAGDEVLVLETTEDVVNIKHEDGLILVAAVKEGVSGEFQQA